MKLNDLFTQPFDRRRFIKSAAGGIGALGFAGCSLTQKISPPVAQEFEEPPFWDDLKPAGTSKVAIAHTSDRRDAAYRSLKPFADDVARGIGSRKVVLKVNCGVPVEETRKCSTYPDQVRGILDFLREIYDGEIIISEGTAGTATSVFHGYELYGLTALEKEYSNVKLIDANDMPYSPVFIRSWQNAPIPINIIDMYRDPNMYLVSVARMKTHNAVIGTFSLKNLVMGSPVCHYRDMSVQKFQRNEKARMHGNEGYWHNDGRNLSYNIFTVAKSGVQPDFSIIDGVTAIEGNGPWGGDIVEHGVSVASPDFVAADRVCTELMKIPPEYMKYIEWCSQAGMGNWDMAHIDVITHNLDSLSRQYKLHDALEEQIAWIREKYNIN